MYVCICRAVTEAEVRGCIADGACTVKEVVKRSEAGTGCGSCIGKIVAMLSTHANGVRQPTVTQRLITA
ncbi:MAG: (2Fe-2S)-binding protein [Pseudonocardiaceae bacterium]